MTPSAELCSAEGSSRRHTGLIQGSLVERSWIAAGAVALLAVGGAVVLWPDPMTTPPIAIIAARPPNAEITVHVSGAVIRPGLGLLPADARVGEAGRGAGG